jgi:hypothetical protein
VLCRGDGRAPPRSPGPHLDLDEEEGVLELQASAGLYTHRDGAHGRIPLGHLKVGRIAQERRPSLSNDLAGDPQISDPQWVRREGLAAFAGCPWLATLVLPIHGSRRSRPWIPESETISSAGLRQQDRLKPGLQRQKSRLKPGLQPPLKPAEFGTGFAQHLFRRAIEGGTTMLSRLPELKPSELSGRMLFEVPSKQGASIRSRLAARGIPATLYLGDFGDQAAIEVPAGVTPAAILSALNSPS